MLRLLGGSLVQMGLCLWSCSSLLAFDSSYQEWQFTNNANPAFPTIASNAAGVAAAAISMGFASSGWLYGPPTYGSQVGLWDLGGQKRDEPEDTRGNITLSVPVPAVASGKSYTDVRLRVLQYVDGLIYTGELEVSPPELLFLERTVVESIPGPLDRRWVEDVFAGRIAPSPQPVLVTVTGATNGTIVSAIRVDTEGPVVLPEDLVITSVQQQNQALIVSWSGGLPPYQIYVATNIAPDSVWEPVGSPETGTSAEIPMMSTSAFVRVRGSQ